MRLIACIEEQDVARKTLAPLLADRLPWLEGVDGGSADILYIPWCVGSPEPFHVDPSTRSRGGFNRMGLAVGELAHVIGGHLVNLRGPTARDP